MRQRTGAAYDRAFHPSGTARQLAAVMSQPDRTPALANVRVAALVIHGDADPLVDPSGGKATAAAIPGARLKLISGMGHDLPPALFAALVADLARHFRREERRHHLIDERLLDDQANGPLAIFGLDRDHPPMPG